MVTLGTDNGKVSKCPIVEPSKSSGFRCGKPVCNIFITDPNAFPMSLNHTQHFIKWDPLCKYCFILFFFFFSVKVYLNLSAFCAGCLQQHGHLETGKPRVILTAASLSVCRFNPPDFSPFPFGASHHLGLIRQTFQTAKPISNC